MNKQEAIRELMSKSREIIFGDDENVYLSRKRTIELVSQIDEPQKVVVPKYVGEWIEYCKSNKLTLRGAFDPASEHGIGLANTFTGKVRSVDWAQRNQDTFARAWMDGYEIEQEKLYTVEIPNNGGTLVLASIRYAIQLVDSNKHFPGKITKESIEEAGFGWVFDCDGVKVVEVG